MSKPVDLEALRRLAANPPKGRLVKVSPLWLQAVARELEEARAIREGFGGKPA